MFLSVFILTYLCSSLLICVHPYLSVFILTYLCSSLPICVHSYLSVFILTFMWERERETDRETQKEIHRKRERTKESKIKIEREREREGGRERVNLDTLLLLHGAAGCLTLSVRRCYSIYLSLNLVHCVVLSYLTLSCLVRVCFIIDLASLFSTDPQIYSILLLLLLPGHIGSPDSILYRFLSYHIISY